MWTQFLEFHASKNNGTFDLHLSICQYVENLFVIMYLILNKRYLNIVGLVTFSWPRVVCSQPETTRLKKPLRRQKCRSSEVNASIDHYIDIFIKNIWIYIKKKPYDFSRIVE